MFDFLSQDTEAQNARRSSNKRSRRKAMPVIRKPVPVSKSGPLLPPKPGDPVEPPPPLTTAVSLDGDTDSAYGGDNDLATDKGSATEKKVKISDDLDFLDDTRADGLDLRPPVKNKPRINNESPVRSVVSKGESANEQLDLENEFDHLTSPKREKGEFEFESDWRDGHPAFRDYPEENSSSWVKRTVLLTAMSLVAGGGFYAYSQGHLDELIASTGLGSQNADSGVVLQSSDSDASLLPNDGALDPSAPAIEAGELDIPRQSPLALKFREQLTLVEALVRNGSLVEAEQALVSMDRSVYGYGVAEFSALEEQITLIRSGSLTPEDVAETQRLAQLEQANEAALDAQQLREEEALATQAAVDAARLEEARIAEQAAAEAQRLADTRNAELAAAEARRLEDARIAEQAAAEAQRLADARNAELAAAEAKRIEDARIAEQAAVEAQQLADARNAELAAAEAKRLEDARIAEQTAAEAQRLADARNAEIAAAEAKRLEDARITEQAAAEAQRLADAQNAQIAAAEAQRLADARNAEIAAAEAKRLADARAAEIAAAEAEASRLADSILNEQRAAEAERLVRLQRAEQIQQAQLLEEREREAAQLLEAQRLERIAAQQTQQPSEQSRLEERARLEVQGAEQIRLDALEESAREEARQQIRAADRLATDRRIAEERAALERQASREARIKRAKEIEAENAARANANAEQSNADNTLALLNNSQNVNSQSANSGAGVSTQAIANAPSNISDNELQIVYQRFANLQNAIKERDITKVVSLTERSGLRVQQLMQVFENSVDIDVRIRNVSTSNATGEVNGTLQIRSITRSDGTLAQPPANLESIKLITSREGDDWSIIRW